MKQQYAFPRVSTRGYFDLRTGSRKKSNPYFLYPKYKLDKIADGDEVVIFIHGMRNTRWGAIHGARILRNKLRKLGYKHPVIAFTYDADIRGAHLEGNYKHVLETAYSIAGDNGLHHLPIFIRDLIDRNPHIKIHLVGHSLGCEVLYWTLYNIRFLSQGYFNIKSVHLFGSPIESNDIENAGKHYNIVNYYNPTDEVIKEGIEKGELRKPSCIFKPNIKHNKRCYAKDHRFKSYVEKLRKFP